MKPITATFSLDLRGKSINKSHGKHLATSFWLSKEGDISSITVSPFHFGRQRQNGAGVSEYSGDTEPRRSSVFEMDA